MKMNSTDRINYLKKRYTDKSLSRTEKQEVLKEISREMYKNDPRKPISIRKQTIINALMSLVLGLNFLFMGTVENLGIKTKYHDIISPIEKVFLLLLFAILILYVAVLSKYKKEPDDELSAKHKLTAQSCGFIFLYAVLFVLVIVYFDVLKNETFVLKSESAMFLFAGLMFTSKFIDNLAFLIIDRTGSSKEDYEDEEEE